MKFKVGDRAVYPALGVAEIRQVEARDVGGTKVNCYVLYIESSGAILIVPVAASERAGMRYLLTATELDDVFRVFSMPAKITQKAWNKRYRLFNEKLRTGDLKEIAEVYRDLWNLQSLKDLSYGEKQMLGKARELLVSEISIVKNKESHTVEKEVEQMMTAFSN